MSDYKVGDWLISKRYGDLWEITGIGSKTVGWDWKISLRIEGHTKKPFFAIFNSMITSEHLEESYEPAPLARLLYDNKHNRGD